MAKLLERGFELAEIDRAIDLSAAGSGRVQLIEGEPGIGKTALLDAVADRAAGGGTRVLAARAGELERDFGFAVVRRLFEPIVRGPEQGAAMAGPARFAAPALGVELSDPLPAASPAESVFPAIHGLYSLTRNLAEHAPLALLIDDAHWADDASLRFVAYLGSRLEELPVMLVLAVRPGDVADRLRHALRPSDVIEPARLSLEATAELVRSLVPEADEDVCRTCHEVTGGNAFYVREVAVAIRDREPGDATMPAADWSPERVTRIVSGRIVALAPGAREVARACAVLGDGASAHMVASLAGLADESVRDALDSLRAGGILAPGERIEFAHPIVGAAVTASIPPGRKASSHALAARLESSGGGSEERIALHLLASDPSEDAWAYERLSAAAREALSRGAPEAAARYLERALAEPAPAAERHRLLLELGTASAFALRPGAAAHVRNAFDLANDEEERLDAALLHAHLNVQAGRGAEGLELLTRVLDESPPQSSRALMIEGFTANITRAQLSARAAAQPIVDRLRSRGEVAEDADPPVLIAIAAELAMMGEQAERATRLADAALRRLDDVPSLARAFAGLTALRVLITADEHERAREVLESAKEAARARGALFDFIYYAVGGANLAYRAGAIFESEAEARAAYELARGERWPLGITSICQYLVQALVERDELEEARALLAENRLDRPPGELADVYTSNAFLLARAGLHAAGDDAEAAMADLREFRDREEAFGERNPSLAPWRSAMALILHGEGEGDEARSLCSAEIELARLWGAPRALGMALRAAGVVAPDGERVALLQEAVEVLEGSFARLELGRAQADLGAAILATGDAPEARRLLRTALETAHLCGAVALERRILEDLRAAGARPRRSVLSGPGSLTPSERRVAELAASGSSNREIAEQLFVAVRTVEYHLQGAYRKLGINERTRLAEALAAGGAAGEEAHGDPAAGMFERR